MPVLRLLECIDRHWIEQLIFGGLYSSVALVRRATRRVAEERTAVGPQELPTALELSSMETLRRRSEDKLEPGPAGHE